MLAHAERAREEAEQAAADNNGMWKLRFREADMHQRSAALLKQTAALYWTRARELRGKTSPDWSDWTDAAGVEAPDRASAARSFAARREKLAAERERLVAEREKLAFEREQIYSTLQWSMSAPGRLASKPPPSHTTADQPTPERAD